MGSSLEKKAFINKEQYFDRTVLSNEKSISEKVLPIFPNPASTYVTVPFGFWGKNDLILMDALGKKVDEQLFFLQKVNNETHINIANLLPGLYVLTNNNGKTYKLVKK